MKHHRPEVARRPQGIETPLGVYVLVDFPGDRLVIRIVRLELHARTIQYELVFLAI